MPEGADGSRSAADGRTPNVLQWFGVFAQSVAVLVFLAAVYDAVRHQDWPRALLFGGAAACFAIPLAQKPFRSRRVPRVTTDHTGTTFRPALSVDVLSAAMMLIGFATCVLWAVLGVTGEVTVPYPYSLRVGYVVMFGLFAALCARYLVKMAGRRGSAYVRLTPDGFVFAEYRTGRGAWNQVSAVTGLRATPYARCPITVTLSNGAIAAIADAGLYATDGDALRDLIRCYWQHPEYRVELSDGRAIDRLRAWQPAPQ
jgi:hypothetical protein